MNDEFDLGISDEQPVAKKTTKAKKAAAPVQSLEALDPLEEPQEAVAPKPPAKVRIMIDEVAGMSNYEVVGVNGKVYQIKRGVPVDVPPEVVTVLEHAQMTHVEHRMNKLTGETEEIRKTFSAIPWRRV